MPFEHIRYTHKYFLDDEYEYRQVILPDHIAKFVPRTHLLSETEWRNMGVCQSPGWIHYMIHPRDRHVLLFRRLRTSNNDPANTESAISSTLN